MVKKLLLTTVLVAAGVVAVQPAQAGRPKYRFTRAELQMHQCWTSRHRLKQTKWKKGNIYEGGVKESHITCLKARKMARQEYRQTGIKPFSRPPFNGTVTPLRYDIDIPISWFIKE